MKTINLAMGLHAHQPVGNFDNVIEEAYQKSYKPFIDVLERHPKVRVALHYTGILYDWFEAHRPEYIARLQALAKNGQVEIMTGGYFEPILPSIPDRDKHGQIVALSEYIKRRFSQTPKGMWLAERVWEPHLPRAIAGAGVEYVIVDDSHFKNVGLSEEEMLGYFITEEQGTTLKIFPGSKKLRYTIPFQHVNATIDYLRELATEDGERMIIFGDDTEKFGVWPETYKHVYENGWLEGFFAELERNSEWIKLVLFSELVAKFSPIGRTYLPTASYSEMMEWALPPRKTVMFEEVMKEVESEKKMDRCGPFLRGGFWRYFLAKYPESNNMNKKAMLVSEKVDKIKDPALKKKAQLELWQGQCNCPYWHGVFGGLYLTHLRSAIYQHLIAAENIADSENKKKDKWLEAKTFDFDTDGNNEIIIETDSLNYYFDPAKGGALFELDSRKANFNIIDTLTRRFEAYHAKLKTSKDVVVAGEEKKKDDGTIKTIHDIVKVKERGLENLLIYDVHRRVSLVDHLMPSNTTFADYSKAKHVELGNFVEKKYEYKLESSDSAAALKMWRDGLVGEKKQALRIEKTVRVGKGDEPMVVEYELKNTSKEAIKGVFAVDFAFNFLAPNSPDRIYFGDDIDPKENTMIWQGVTHGQTIGLKDEYMKLQVTLCADIPTRFWRFPLLTVSNSEDGFEKGHQGVIVAPNWQIAIAPGESWKVKITQAIKRL